jgi:hypothetical protein
LTVVACIAPLPSRLPCAVMHFPCAIDCVLAAACLLHRVLSVTVTVVGAAPSLRLTVIVSPATDATVPPTLRCPAGPLEGDGPGVDEPAEHWPPAALMRTDRAVTAPGFPAPSRAGRMLTQIPAVTSGRAAGVVSLIAVDGVTCTVAVPLCCVTWMVSPVTDAIRPATLPVPPGAGAGEGVCVGACACALVEPVGPAGAVGVAVFELPHAATDSAVAPTTANIPSRVTRGADEPAVFTVPPIMNVRARRTAREFRVEADPGSAV